VSPSLNTAAAQGQGFGKFKAIFQSLWLALKPDARLPQVLLSIYAIIIVAIISLALGLFQDFGTAHPPGIPQ
jgi:hypothetical protein